MGFKVWSNCLGACIVRRTAPIFIESNNADVIVTAGDISPKGLHWCTISEPKKLLGPSGLRNHDKYPQGGARGGKLDYLLYINLPPSAVE